jgi:hypothetical protein
MQFTDQPLPSCDQLEKIVQSLSLLIEMQRDRDERQASASEAILNQLDSLQNAVNQLATAIPEQRPSEPDVDENLVKSICAKYGLETDNLDSSSDEFETSSGHSDSAGSQSEVEPVAHADKTQDDEKVDEQSPREIPPMDLEEINAIKQRLHEKLREAEIELSVRRASLSQREAVLEEKEARLQQELQRKLILSSEVDGNSGGNTMLSRLKVHLREFAAAKIGKSSQNPDADSVDHAEVPPQTD